MVDFHHCVRDMPPQSASVNDLPNELLEQVLLFLPALSIPAFEQTCRRFSKVVKACNWRRFCRIQFRYWGRNCDEKSRPEDKLVETRWKRIYIERHRTHQETSNLIDSILSSQVGRIDKFQRIVEIGYDAKDCLLQHLATCENASDVLARRYYSDAALGCLHRAMAIEQWSKLRLREDTPLEQALTAFDMFVLHGRQGDFEEISVLLDSIAAQCLEESPKFQQKATREKAISIANYLSRHSLLGIRGSGDHRYHDLQNNFIGFALYEQDHASLPLISAVIYCCVARRLGVDARPCALPLHVVVAVRAPGGFDADGNYISPDQATLPVYMDPFETDQEISIHTLQSRLTLVGIPQSQQNGYLEESTSVSDMVVRTGLNILRSVQELHQQITAQQSGQGNRVSLPISPDLEGAFYGALWASLLLGVPANGDGPLHATISPRRILNTFATYFETHFPTDVGLIERYIVPLFRDPPESAQLRESIRVTRSVDSMPKQVKRRTKDISEHVRYKIGQVFQHKRYAYAAIITGWDTECGANQEWKDRMRVHELSRGAGQSFYHVLVEDKSVRYVAEENIHIIRPDVPHSLMDLAGKHFKRWDKRSKCFISNIRDEYPDD